MVESLPESLLDSFSYSYWTLPGHLFLLLLNSYWTFTGMLCLNLLLEVFYVDLLDTYSYWTISGLLLDSYWNAVVESLTGRALL